MFFDDNIKFSQCYIVNPVDLGEREKQHWCTPLLRTHLVRAEPWESISNNQYFVDQVVRLEEGYEMKLRYREKLTKMLKHVRNLTRVESGRSRLRDLKEKPGDLVDFDPWAGKRRDDNQLSLAQEEEEEEEEYDESKGSVLKRDSFLVPYSNA